MKKITSLLLSFLMFFMVAAYAEVFIPEQGLQPEEQGVAAAADPLNAYLILGENIQGSRMRLIEDTSAKRYDELYNEKVVFRGKQGRQVYKENYLYFSLDDDFIGPNDHEIAIVIEYFCYDNGKGYFHFDYNSTNGNDYQRRSVQKSAPDAQWCTQTITIDDFDLRHAQKNGADLRIASNLYNTFSKIEIINVSRARKRTKELVGASHYREAEALQAAGLLEKDVSLLGGITREDVARHVTKLANPQLLDMPKSCSFHDVREENAPYAAYAVGKGWMSGDEQNGFMAQRDITVRELLTVFLRMLGAPDENIYENCFALAKQYQLIQDSGVVYLNGQKSISNSDLIYSADKKATGDNLVILAYRALFAKINGRTLIKQLMEADKGMTERLRQSEDEKMSGSVYEGASFIPKEEIKDEVTGRTIQFVSFNGINTLRPYVTQNEWDNKSERIVFGVEGTNNALYSYHTETGETVFLGNGCLNDGICHAYVTEGNDVYYQNRADGTVNCVNLDTMENRVVAAKNAGVPQVTADGKFLGGYWGYDTTKGPDGNQRLYIAPRLNTQTGEWDLSCRHEFNEVYGAGYYNMGHPMINPKYPDLMAYCHEGDTSYVPDRAWVYNYQTGEHKVLIPHAIRQDGINGETIGHEKWSWDGEYMYAVKFSYPQNIGVNGIIRVKKDGTERTYFPDNEKYHYWHCSASPDNNWIVADVLPTGTAADQYVDIVLINTKTNEQILVCRAREMENTNHPNQPHPCFSPDGKKISFNTRNADGVLGIGWVDVSDLVAQVPQDKGRQLSDSVTYVSYENSAVDVNEVQKAGQNAVKIGRDKELAVCVDDTVCYEAATEVSLRITYYDEGVMPIRIVYSGGVKNTWDLANYENCSYELVRTDSKKWKTQVITLANVNMQNACGQGADFKISGAYSAVYLQNVEWISASDK